MPLRSVKMNRFILGFQRRVWGPKWVPLSSSCFMLTTAITGHSFVVGCRPASGEAGPWRLLRCRTQPEKNLVGTARHAVRTLSGTPSRGAGARSQPANELRAAVYTDSAGGFSQQVSTRRYSCTDLANAVGLA